ncbi:MAG TPA: DUF4412 domain-containing protein [Vicinamibacteria bacterium]|nr:DUF4412 domain-containing protein [Vicinamibacteria bacterium]
MIVRLDTGRFIYLDHEGRTYSEITFDQLREMTSQLAGDDAADGQRHQEAMRRMGLESGPAKLTRLGSGETIAGYATEKYLIETSSIQMEISAAPDLEIPAAYYEAFSPRGDNAPGPMGDMGKVFEEIKKIRGMILKQVSTFAFMGENTVTTTIATSVEKGAIPASTFEVPVGYKAVPLEN